MIRSVTGKVAAWPDDRGGDDADGVDDRGHVIEVPVGVTTASGPAERWAGRRCRPGRRASRRPGRRRRHARPAAVALAAVGPPRSMPARPERPPRLAAPRRGGARRVTRRRPPRDLVADLDRDLRDDAGDRGGQAGVGEPVAGLFGGRRRPPRRLGARRGDLRRRGAGRRPGPSGAERGRRPAWASARARALRRSRSSTRGELGPRVDRARRPARRSCVTVPGTANDTLACCCGASTPVPETVVVSVVRGRPSDPRRRSSPRARQPPARRRAGRAFQRTSGRRRGRWHQPASTAADAAQRRSRADDAAHRQRPGTGRSWRRDAARARSWRKSSRAPSPASGAAHSASR